MKNEIEKNNLSWNEYYMELARLTAKRSKDPKTKVGCAIINPKNNHVISIGYNGLPFGMNDEDFDWKEEKGDKNPYVVHAEANAILNSATENLEGFIAYCTMFPCNECAKLLAQKKISTVVYDNDKFLKKDNSYIAKKILSSAGITTIKYDKEIEKWSKNKGPK